MFALFMFALCLLLYVVVVVWLWPASGEPPIWAWPLVPVLFTAVKLWDQRRTVAVVVGVYGGVALFLFLGHRFNLFLLG
jgi:hypothetical protein